MCETGSESGHLPKQNLGKKLGEARAAAWCMEQDLLRAQKDREAKAQQSTNTVIDAHTEPAKKRLKRWFIF